MTLDFRKRAQAAAMLATMMHMRLNMIRLGLFGALTVTVLCIVFLVDFRSLNEALAAWFDGKSTMDTVMWNHSMLWWGRFGKLLTVAAGFSVVLDLIDPKWLRKKGRSMTASVRRLKREASDTAERRKVIKLREELMMSLLAYRLTSTISLQGPPFIDDLTIASKERRAENIRAIVEEHPRFTADALKVFHGDALDALGHVRAGFSFRARGALDNMQVDALRKVATNFYITIATPGERALLETQGNFESQYWRARIVAPLAGICLLISGFAVVMSGSGPLGSLLLFIGVILSSMIPPSDTPKELLNSPTILSVYVIRLISLGPLLLLCRGLAAILDRARPAHFFRWLAFASFLVGSFFDILAT